MSIILIGRDQVPLGPIAEYLKQEGIEEIVTVPWTDVSAGSYPSHSSAITFLISVTQNFVDEGEDVARVRLLLESQAKLILCMLRPPESAAQALIQHGADEIISPRKLDADVLGERILAHLILHGLVQPNTCESLWGATLQMRKIFNDIEKYAQTNEIVLIRGETGTGKGLVAEALHHKARRTGKRTGRLVTIVLAEINPELIGSELFGHVDGAFTSANRSRMGRIEFANEGTAFIDEIGDLDAHSQIRLLRLVENRVFVPLGANAEKPATARFVFATHCNLEERLTNNTFREDLYARIKRLVVQMPALRDHRADIPLLVKYLLERYNEKNGSSVSLAPGAVDELFRYDWPHNVRELDDVIIRAASDVLPDGVITDTIFQESIQDHRQPTVNGRRYTNTVGFDPLEDKWSDVEGRAREEYLRVLRRVTNNVDHASALSGIGRSQLYKYMAKYGINLW
jgi:DNA-binding NtrC family response regulator